MALVAYDSSDDSETDDAEERQIASAPTAESRTAAAVEDVVEAEYKMRIPASARTTNSKSQIFNSVKNSVTSKLLLTIPALNELDSSSDDEYGSANSGKCKGAKQAAASGSSLLDLLPKPRGFTVREGGRLMIPHQLIRRPAAASTKATGSTQSIITKKSTEPVPPRLDEAEDTFSDHDDDHVTADSSDQSEASLSISRPSTSSNFFALHEFGDKAGIGPVLLANPRVDQWPVASKSAFALGQLNQGTESDHAYPELGPSCSGAGDESSSYATFDEAIIPQPERKRLRHGPIDPSQIRVVNQADLLAGAQIELTKGITRDDDQWVTRPNKEDQPGKTASRKHQITWLAFKAKEREFELQNKWADAKFNRKVSYSKYGF